jgi:hypothetical protein
MDTNTYFCRLHARLERVGIESPDPVDTPRAFAAWRRVRRDIAAAARGQFPHSGKGWVFVPAIDPAKGGAI